MFREDSEFHDGAAPSHLGHAPLRPPEAPKRAQAIVSDTPVADTGIQAVWSADAEKELKKIPFFVRGKARGNTERFARERGVTAITVGTLYDAKAHFGR
jgi:light-independent protochlorophyllide reductase subunit B